MQVLSDEEKRSRYDLTGRVEDLNPHHHRSTHQGFTVFQSGNGFQFHFNFPGGGSGKQRDDAIGFQDFSGSILPGSYRKPYLLYFHSELCFECMRVDNVWTQLKNVSGFVGPAFQWEYFGEYSELPLIWTPEMKPPLYSGHYKMSQSMLPSANLPLK